MQDIYRVARPPDADDLTVMIVGEIGHGQGARRPRAARLRQAPQRALRRHQHGRHPARPDRDPSSSATRRAPSPARRRAPGRFEQAEGGTLFLDEIGDMPMEAQTRLLRVLQQGEYTTVGGRTPIKTNVRIVAATNKDLRISIPGPVPRGPVLPPQRGADAPAAAARAREDVPDLVRHFFALVEKEGLPAQADRFGRDGRSSGYRWPGNIRELENLVRRLRRSIRRRPSPPRSSRQAELATPGLPRPATTSRRGRHPVGLGRAPSQPVFQVGSATISRRRASITAFCARWSRP
jgi:two-component system nitrogen regulation response regulator GlnG